VLLDVTAMDRDAVCVAGWDIERSRMVRLNDPQPTKLMLGKFGGLKPGDIIEVSLRDIRATPPHVEDAGWDVRSLRKIETCDHEHIRLIAEAEAFDGVEAAFGANHLRASNSNHGWPINEGVRSLAWVKVHYVRFNLDQQGRMRAAIRDVADKYWQGIPFQDLSVRTHLSDCAPCKGDPLAAVKREFSINRCFVRVGLTRPFAPSAGDPRLWLQLTNVVARPREHF
jgi:hypothetical protein